MVLYEVTVTADAAVALAFEEFLRTAHVRDVLATGCFQSARLVTMTGGIYRAAYAAATQSDLDRYLELFAPALRNDVLARFPNGLVFSRQVWEVLEDYGHRA